MLGRCKDSNDCTCVALISLGLKGVSEAVTSSWWWIDLQGPCHLQGQGEQMLSQHCGIGRKVGDVRWGGGWGALLCVMITGDATVPCSSLLLICNLLKLTGGNSSDFIFVFDLHSQHPGHRQWKPSIPSAEQEELSLVPSGSPSHQKLSLITSTPGCLPHFILYARYQPVTHWHQENFWRHRDHCFAWPYMELIRFVQRERDFSLIYEWSFIPLSLFRPCVFFSLSYLSRWLLRLLNWR